MTSKAVFQSKLEAFGAAHAPNGADYKLINVSPVRGQSTVFHVERVYQGDRETIVDWNSEPFANLAAARQWAKMDGCLAAPFGVPITERQLITA